MKSRKIRNRSSCWARAHETQQQSSDRTGHLNARPRAVRNGAKGVDRAAAACFRAVFLEQTDPETTKAVLHQFQKIRARAEERGPHPTRWATRTRSKR